MFVPQTTPYCDNNLLSIDGIQKKAWEHFTATRLFSKALGLPTALTSNAQNPTSEYNIHAYIPCLLQYCRTQKMSIGVQYTNESLYRCLVSLCSVKIS